MVYSSTDIIRLAMYLNIEVVDLFMCHFLCVWVCVKHAIDTKMHLLQRCSPNSDLMLCVHI